MDSRLRRRLGYLFWAGGLALLFVLYTSGLKRNPPGFYLDESAHAYNSYLVAHTGAGEIGPRFPLFVQYYAAGSAQYADSVQIYLLAAVFRFLPPSILLARIVSAFWIFGGCLLLGLLARRISGRRTIGVIVAATALLTPWFFEGRGLVLEHQFVPLALALFLLALYHVQKKERWGWRDIAKLAGTLAAVTYCFTTGCVLGPLLALGLLFFTTTRQRLIGIIKTGLLYGLMLVPILLFDRGHPGILAKRFHDASYIKPGVPWSDVAGRFVKRYLEDQNLNSLVVSGDSSLRHHVPGSGVLFFATLILVLIGVVVILARRRSDPWWRFVLYGVAVAVVPGAISNLPFHEMRLIAYPVFLLLLTVPALEWLLDRDKSKSRLARSPSDESGDRPAEDGPFLEPVVAGSVFPRAARLWILCAVVALTLFEAYRFQTVFRREGPKRLSDFDVAYKEAYSVATRQPDRPIYLENGKGGPAYIHALWYATVEKRPTSQFVHLAPGAKPPPGKIVISSAENCQGCQTLARFGVYHVYKSL